MPPNFASPADANHEYWMRQALRFAGEAGDRDEVPIGAVLVDSDSGELLGSGFNQPIGTDDPTAHAEIVALRNAARFVGNYRLPGTALYVTIEPCTMCVGAMIHARIELLVFGARELKAGAIVSRQRLLGTDSFNHQLVYKEGILADECSELMRSFFKAKRNAP